MVTALGRGSTGVGSSARQEALEWEAVLDRQHWSKEQQLDRPWRRQTGDGNRQRQQTWWSSR